MDRSTETTSSTPTNTPENLPVSIHPYQTESNCDGKEEEKKEKPVPLAVSALFSAVRDYVDSRQEPLIDVLSPGSREEFNKVVKDAYTTPDARLYVGAPIKVTTDEGTEEGTRDFTHNDDTGNTSYYSSGGIYSSSWPARPAPYDDFDISGRQ